MALRTAAITRGKSVYPMMLTDCMKELEHRVSNEQRSVMTESTHMFPPSSLICKVTTASPIQTIEKTPEKTRSDCSLEARRERNMLSKRQNISGPLCAVLAIKSLITGF